MLSFVRFFAEQTDEMIDNLCQQVAWLICEKEGIDYQDDLALLGKSPKNLIYKTLIKLIQCNFTLPQISKILTTKGLPDETLFKLITRKEFQDVRFVMSSYASMPCRFDLLS